MCDENPRPVASIVTCCSCTPTERKRGQVKKQGNSSSLFRSQVLGSSPEDSWLRVCCPVLPQPLLAQEPEAVGREREGETDNSSKLEVAQRDPGSSSGPGRTASCKPRNVVRSLLDAVTSSVKGGSGASSATENKYPQRLRVWLSGLG